MKKIISIVLLSFLALLFWGGTLVLAADPTPSFATPGSPDFVGPPAPPPEENSNASTPDCSVSESDLTDSSVSIGDMLRPCRPTWVITTDSTDSKDFKIDGGARERIIAIANQIILAGSLLAVWAIVYAAILYTIAAWDDEKIKKAKGSLKFGIIGFVMMLISFPLVNAIIKLFYSTSS